ncbi:MAG: RNA polymerase sigma factor (sigma-70 family) [Rhodothermales bacterium]|jgi:RNA polymerase sigma factor (sigma-70 family)
MNHVTQESLLLKLQDIEDVRAWDRFYEMYGNFIFNFARKRGCHDQLAQDVVQETLITLSRMMPEFNYDPDKGRFRGFLLTVVKSRIVDAWRREQKQTAQSKSKGKSNGESEVIPSEAMDTMEDKWLSNWEDEWDREWENHLLVEGMKRIEDKVQPHVLESFRRYVLQGQPAADVAAAMGTSEANIYNQRRRVLTILQREVSALRAELGE